MHMRSVYGHMASLLIEKGVCLESRIIPGGTHSEGSWEKQIPYFMDSLLYPEISEF